MNNSKTFLRFGFLLALLGCDFSTSTDSRRTNPVSKEDMLKAIQDAENQAALTPPPEAKIMLPVLPDWLQSKRRSLPDGDGFSVAYDHRLGMTVTFYQFTRGQAPIPTQLSSPVLQREVIDAKSGIEAAVELGFWDGAKELEESTAPLGDSPCEVLWLRHGLMKDKTRLVSDTYIWSHDDAIMKLRCTRSAKSSDDEEAALTELLTAFGEASSIEAR